MVAPAFPLRSKKSHAGPLRVASRSHKKSSDLCSAFGYSHLNSSAQWGVVGDVVYLIGWQRLAKVLWFSWPSP